MSGCRRKFRSTVYWTLSGVCLAMAAGLLVLLFRSYTTCDGVQRWSFVVRPISAPAMPGGYEVRFYNTVWYVHSERSVIVFHWEHYYEIYRGPLAIDPPPTFPTDWRLGSLPIGQSIYVGRWQPAGWRAFSLAYDPHAPSVNITGKGEGLLEVTIPHWAVILPLLFIGIIPFFKIWRRRKRRATVGYCAQCGYDLRASKDRCPECGRPFIRSFLPLSLDE